MNPKRPLPSVYLVDDQAMIRAAFKALLHESRIADVVGENGDARAAIDEIRKIKPDLVLLDVGMAGLGGFEALPLILQANPGGRVIMLTNQEGRTVVRRAFEGGAAGYLSKDSEPDELAEAIVAVMNGGQYVSPRANTGRDLI